MEKCPIKSFNSTVNTSSVLLLTQVSLRKFGKCFASTVVFTLTEIHIKTKYKIKLT